MEVDALEAPFRDLAPSVAEHLASQGWTPTPIQRLAIERLAAGDEALLVAPTGSGKTEAAILPLLHRSLVEDWEPLGILYITPLRALNRDIDGRLQALGAAVGRRVDVRHGDTTQSQRTKQVRKPPDVLITTPETLQLLFTGHRVRDMIRTVRAVVLDELHDLAGSERGAQLAFGLARLEALAQRRIQRVGCSATVGNPDELAGWLRPSATPIIDPGARRLDLQVIQRAETPGDEAQALELGTSPPALAGLHQLVASLQERRPAIIFVNSRNAAETVTQRLRDLAPSLRLGVHHGSLAVETREQMESDLRSGELDAIVSTSSLELGIDVGSIEQVLQLQSPRSVDRLLQRVGRAEHVLGGTSRGRLIAWEVDELAEGAVLARRAIVGELEPVLWREQPMTVLVHQLLHLGHQRRIVPIAAVAPLLEQIPGWASWQQEATVRLLRQLQDRWMVTLCEDPLDLHPDDWPDDAFKASSRGEAQLQAARETARGHSADPLEVTSPEVTTPEEPATAGSTDAKPAGAAASAAGRTTAGTRAPSRAASGNDGVTGRGDAHGPAYEARRQRAARHAAPAAAHSTRSTSPATTTKPGASVPKRPTVPEWRRPRARPSAEDAKALLALLDPRWLDGWYLVRGRGIKHTRERLSMIPDERRYKVRDAVERRMLGTVDEGFVLSLNDDDGDAATAGSEARRFVMAGRTWRLISADPEEEELLVAPAAASAQAPVWSGELPPVPATIAREVGWLRRALAHAAGPAPAGQRGDLDRGEALDGDVPRWADPHAPPWRLGIAGPQPTLAAYPLDDTSQATLLEAVLEHHERTGAIPSDRLLTVEQRTDAIVVNSCHGSQVNRALAHLVQAMASTRTGTVGQLLVEPLRFAIRMTGATPELIAEVLRDTAPDMLEGILAVTLPRSVEMRWRLVQVAKIFGMLPARIDPRRVNLHGLIRTHAGTPMLEESLAKLFHERLDLPGAADVLAGLRDDEIGLRLTPPGPLGRSPRAERDLLLPDWSSGEVRERLAKRLDGERAVQCCLKCRSTRGFRVARFPQLEPPCQACGGTMLATAAERLRDRLEAWVASDDHATQQRMSRNASLVQRRGLDAVRCLMARGVGEDTATRILRAVPPGDDEALFEAIHGAEVQYARTRRFWG